MSTDSDERKLVERAAEGDAAAFGQLYQRHVDRVYSFLMYRVRDPELADDLCQEVFVQAMRGLQGFSWQGSLVPWLMRIARNQVIDHWRRTGRRPERPVSHTESPGDDGEEGSRLDRLVDEHGQEDLERAERALDRPQLMQASEALTDLQRQVVALRFGAGLSIRETAEIMDRSEGAIKNLQHHAVRGLRAALEAVSDEAMRDAEDAS